MVWYGVVWYGVVWYCVVLYSVVLCCMVWYGMVWNGMEWYGMVCGGTIERWEQILPCLADGRVWCEAHRGGRLCLTVSRCFSTGQHSRVESEAHSERCLFVVAIVSIQKQGPRRVAVKVRCDDEDERVSMSGAG